MSQNSQAEDKIEDTTKEITAESLTELNKNVTKTCLEDPRSESSHQTEIAVNSPKKQKQNVVKTPAEDPCSELFDPLHALYAENLRISKKAPPIQFQNLAAFDSALKKHGIWGLQQKPHKPGTDSTAASTSKNLKEEAQQTTRRFLPHQMPIKAPAGTSGLKQRHTKNLLKWLEKVEGPLKLLAEAMASKRQVRVVVRNERGVRGHMVGTVISFDRHWNLLLKDVIEVWCRRKFKYGVNKTCEADNPSQDCTVVLEELGITLPSQTVKSLNRRNVEITRKLEQLFIRGEQVVLVNFLGNNK